MAKDPAFLFYPGDWMGGTITFSRSHKGAYMDLLMCQYNQGHMSLHDIQTILGTDFEPMWEPKLKSKFKTDANGLFYNEKLENEIVKRKKFTESRRQNLSHKKAHVPAHMDHHMENENIYFNTKIGEESQREEERLKQGRQLKKPVVDMSIELLAQREGKLKAGIDLAREAEACYDYYLARGTQLEDPQAAFRNWVRNWSPPAIVTKHPKKKTQDEIHQDNLAHVKQMLRGVK